jgi:hypothetical protein
MKTTLLIISLICHLIVNAQYAPPAGQSGSTAIHKDSSIIVNWATEVTEFNRGYQDIANQTLGLVTLGDSSMALGSASGNNAGVVSLGDYGNITLTFQYPIINGLGPDFVIFENGFSDTFLELAFVEVSSDGLHFVRFPSVSLTPETEIGGFGSIDATKLYNLAGKYRVNYGTPFDLEDLTDSTNININEIKYIKLIDAVGTTNTQYATYDSQGHIIIDPYATPFESGGFDLDAIGVINEDKSNWVNELERVNFSVFPNPSLGQINLYCNKSGVVKIFDMTGKIVFDKNIISKETITLDKLNKGLYFINFNQNGMIETKKIIVQ